jgi:hypothetical protein
MKRIVKGLEQLNGITSSVKSFMKEIRKMEKDEEQKEEKTQRLIQKLKQGEINQETLQELIKEEKIEVNEEDELVKLLQNLIQGEEKESEILGNVVNALAEEEKKEDQSLNNLKEEIKSITQEGLTQEKLSTIFSHSKSVADRLLDESQEEVKASKLSENIAEELGITAKELFNAEQLEKEEETEEKEIEQIAESVNNKKLDQMIQQLEKHTANDEQQVQEDEEMLYKIIDQDEATEEELEKETVHTREEAQELLSLLRKLKQMAQNSPLENKEFQQNFEDLMNEVGEAEKRTETGQQIEEEVEDEDMSIEEAIDKHST